MNIKLKHSTPASIISPGTDRHLAKKEEKRQPKPFQISFFERHVLLIAGDIAIIVLATICIFLIQPQPAEASLTRWLWLPVLLAGWWFVAWLADLYHVPDSSEKLSSVRKVALVGLINLAIYLILFSLLPASQSRRFFLSFLLLVWPAITLWRLGYAAVVPHVPHRILIVGMGQRSQLTAASLSKQVSKLNYQVVGFVNGNEEETQSVVSEGLAVLGHASELLELAQEHQIHEVIVAADDPLTAHLSQWLIECQAHGIQVSLMANFFERLYRKILVEQVEPAWVLYAIQDRSSFSRFQLSLKRLMDVVISLIGLLFFIPLLPILALVIKLDSPGPVFYRQQRAGQAGKPFDILKFRTMVTNAEQDGQPQWASKGDSRITRVGRLLRKTRLDELPQLINVLQGDMSFVGPRPERPEFIEMLQQEIPYYRTRMLMKPGLTGWAQIHYDYGNSAEDALRKLQYDFYYVRYWSLWMDFRIIFQTWEVVLKLKGT